MSTPRDHEPAVGTVVRDEQRSRVGEFRGVQSGRFMLRPIGGGREWEARPDEVRPVPADEALRLRVAAANRYSRAARGVA